MFVVLDLLLKPSPTPTNSSSTLPTNTNDTKQTDPTAIQTRQRLHAYLDALPTETAAHGALSSLVHGVLLHTAARLRCTHVALGTTLTALSMSLLTSVSYGAGAHVPEALSEDWVPPPNALIDASQASSDGSRSKKAKIRVVRPLQDIGAKECAAYVRWRNLPVVPLHPSSDFAGKATIGGLTSGKLEGRYTSKFYYD